MLSISPDFLVVEPKKRDAGAEESVAEEGSEAPPVDIFRGNFGGSSSFWREMHGARSGGRNKVLGSYTTACAGSLNLNLPTRGTVRRLGSAGVCY